MSIERTGMDVASEMQRSLAELLTAMFQENDEDVTVLDVLDNLACAGLMLMIAPPMNPASSAYIEAIREATSDD